MEEAKSPGVEDGEPTGLMGGGHGVSGHSQASGHSQVSGGSSSTKGVSLGAEYRVCADEGVVVEINDLLAKHQSNQSNDSGPTGLLSKGASFKPQLMHAFSSKTANALRMARGKSYEGEDFSLSWNITLQVTVPAPPPPANDSSQPQQPAKGGLGLLGRRGGRPATAKKTILNGIVGHAEKGQLVAVMGSSGCGKTSFLDCLSMRNQSFAGNIFVNGREIDGRYFSLAGFVHQDDIFIPTETVREHLVFHAMLRCDPCIRKEARLQRVDKLLRAVNLAHVANSMLGGPGSFVRGLSGGERRRVSFATELLSDPVIIFADEFTTGLDAAMAKAVCQSLRNVAHSGRLVIGTIHQPSSEVFALFTHVMLMTQGRLVYMGPRKALGDYFERVDPTFACPGDHNPADFYVQLVALNPDQAEATQARIDKLVGAFAASPEFAALNEWKEDVGDPDLLNYHRSFKMRHFHAKGPTQFRHTFHRNLKSLYRDPLAFASSLFCGVFTALLLGLAYQGPANAPVDQDEVRDKTGLFFLVNLMMLIECLYTAIMAFASETKVFMRENQAGANRVGSYFLAKMSTNWATEILVPFLFGTIIYWIAGLRRGVGAFWTFMLVNVLNAMCAGSIGYCLAAMTEDDKIAFAIAPPLLFPNMIFSGIMYDLNQVKDVRAFLSYISVIRFSIGAMTVNEFAPEPGRYAADPRFSSPEKVWDHVAAYPLWTNVAVLAAYMVGIRFAAYLLLLNRTARARVKVL